MGVQVKSTPVWSLCVWGTFYVGLKVNNNRMKSVGGGVKQAVISHNASVEVASFYSIGRCRSRACAGGLKPSFFRR